MDQIKQILELMDRPAFSVENGCIQAVNTAAAARQVESGVPIRELLTSGQEDFAEFTGGHLCLPLRICGADYIAVVTSVGQQQLFTLEPEEAEEELRMLELAAMELREPLNYVMALVDELPRDVDRDHLARINRGLHQLLRIVGNMSGHPMPRFEMMDLNALLQEVSDSVLPVWEGRGIRFRFTPHPVPVYSFVDGELITRAVYNLLSNALKFTEAGGSAELRLTMSRTSYQISLYNSSPELNGMLSDPFSRFRRMPAIEDGRTGLGLGLRLVRCAAIAHGGTALVDSPPEGGVRVVLRLPRRQNSTGLRSGRHQISYSGERSPMLIELSDVLPPEYYIK